MSESINPQQLRASIGGGFGPCNVARWEDGKLIWEYLDNNVLRKTQEIEVTEAQWLSFWAACDKADVWNWKERYENPGIVDGTSWRAHVEHGDKSVDSSGCNSFPEGFGIWMTAVRELVGNRQFE